MKYSRVPNPKGKKITLSNQPGGQFPVLSPIQISSVTGHPSWLCKYCKYTCLSGRCIYLVQMSSPRISGPSLSCFELVREPPAEVLCLWDWMPARPNALGNEAAQYRLLILVFIGIYTLVWVAGYGSFINQSPTLGLSWEKGLAGKERKYREVRENEKKKKLHKVIFCSWKHE